MFTAVEVIRTDSKICGSVTKMKLARLLSPLFVGGCLLSSLPASAQQLSLEGLEQRLVAVERENARLKAEIEALRANRDASAPASAPVSSSGPAVSRGEAVTTLAGETEAPRRPGLWDHAYAGVTFGYSETRVAQPLPLAVNTTSSLRGKASGGMVGWQIGRRWQSGRFVTGLELALDIPANKTVFILAPLRIDADVRLKGQVGFAAGSWLLYGQGGLQVSHMRQQEYTIQASKLVRVGETSRNIPGMFYGLGIARQLSPELSVELEGTISSIDYRASPRFVTGTFDITDQRQLALRLNYLFP